MARERLKKIKFDVSVQVLQNGRAIDELIFPLEKKRTLTIGNVDKANFSLPHYSFARRIQSICRFKKDRVEVSLKGAWQGYYSNGEKFSLVADGSEKSVVRATLRGNDVAFFHNKDLSLLFKINARKKLATSRSLINFRPGFFSLFVAGPFEGQALGSGLVLAALMVGLMLRQLFSISPSANYQFSDLSLDYTLPFVYPRHIRNLPEAIQEELQRKDYRKDAIKFSEALTALYMGWKNPYPNLVFDNSQTLFEKYHVEQKEKLDQIRQKQKGIDTKLSDGPATAALSIPSVEGESVRGSIGRIFDKIDLMHEGLEMNLANRKQIIADFQADPKYDFGDYKSGGFKQSKEAKEALSKISPFDMLSDEATMYKTAEDLAQQALIRQDQIEKNSTPKIKLFDQRYMPIGILAPSSTSSYLEIESFVVDDKKINSLLASEFQSRSDSGKTIKEPLIGEIEPNLIERTIKKRQFELQLCYEIALRKNKVSQGNMEWRWRIDSYGQISELSLVSSSIGDKSMESCIRKKIAQWTFPRPRRGSVEVSYPFVFQKKRG